MIVLSIGCSYSGTEGFIDLVNSGASVMIPDLVKYIEADTKLDKEQKEIRIKSAKEFQKMIEEEKALYDKNNGKTTTTK